MTFQVRLYIHHDNDLIQLHLNGIRLCDVFAKSLEAHYKKEPIRFTLPESLEFQPHKGKVYRIKVTLDDKKQEDLIKWVCAFPDQYKCHCIKNIARAYLGSTVIDSLNGMSQNGEWNPDVVVMKKGIRIIQLHKRKKKKDEDEDAFQWIERVSANRKKTESQIRKAEEGREKIYNMPVEQILGTGHTATAEGSQAISSPVSAARIPTAQDAYPENRDSDVAIGYPEAETGGNGSFYSIDADDRNDSKIDASSDTSGIDDFDDFDASLFFEHLRSQ